MTVNIPSELHYVAYDVELDIVLDNAQSYRPDDDFFTNSTVGTIFLQSNRANPNDRLRKKLRKYD